MKVQRGRLDEIEALEGRRAVTLGTFDGVHRGHQAILRELRSIAGREDLGGACVVTFGIHPRAVTSPRSVPALLTDVEERCALLRAAGIERLVVLEFDEELAATSYVDFVRDFLVGRLGMGHFVLGHDVHFGRNREGNLHSVADLAESLGFTLSQVASVRAGTEPISSTRIRECIAQGRVEEAVELLGHPFPIRGEVVHGRALGRQIDVRTANLLPPAGKVLPPPGVLAGYARWGGGRWERCVVNVGTAPTVREDGRLLVEAHLLDAEADLYGHTLELAILARLRPERRFSDLEALREQIGRDQEDAREALAAPAGAARPGLLDHLEGADPSGPS